MNIRLLDLAEKDLLDSVRFYQRPPNPVGAYFLDSLYSDIESLRLYAGIHRNFSSYHRLLSKRFPFAIYYAMTGDEIAIWRILDCRRDPQWIARQLKPSRRRKR